jgi:hypothetical protein
VPGRQLHEKAVRRSAQTAFFVCLPAAGSGMFRTTASRPDTDAIVSPSRPVIDVRMRGVEMSFVWSAPRLALIRHVADRFGSNHASFTALSMMCR